MRRKALESELIIVNHHLFFADLNIKQQAPEAADAGILPAAAAVIFDEAHELEEIASNYFGIGLSNARIDELTRDVDIMLRAKQASSSSIESACATLKDRSRMFFGALPMESQPLGRMPFDPTQRESFLESDGDTYLATLNALQRVEAELERVKNVEESKGLVKRTSDIRMHLKFLLESDDKNTVFWIERRATAGVRALARGAYQPSFHTHLQATPIDVSALLSTTLFDAYSSVILTSATLTVAASFEHFTKRLGLASTRELTVPSHFNYPKQCLLYLPPGMPDPRDPDFTAQAAERIRRMLEITRGRAFCLFTSYSQMRTLYDRMLSDLPYPLLLHGNAPRHVLLQQFRDTPNASFSAPAPSGRASTCRASSSPASSSTSSPSPSPATLSSRPAWTPSKPPAANPSSICRFPPPSSPSNKASAASSARSTIAACSCCSTPASNASATARSSSTPSRPTASPTRSKTSKPSSRRIERPSFRRSQNLRSGCCGSRRRVPHVSP